MDASLNTDNKKRKTGSIGDSRELKKQRPSDDRGYLAITGATSRPDATPVDQLICNEFMEFTDANSPLPYRRALSLTIARHYATAYLTIDLNPKSRFMAWFDTLIKKNAKITSDEETDMVKALQMCQQARSFQPLIDLFELEKVYKPPVDAKHKKEKGPDIDAIVVEKAFNREYQGNKHEVLLASILRDSRSLEYANTGVILQSSGYGKSRMLDQLAKVVTTIPMNIRQDKETAQAAYPPPDPGLLEFFQNISKCSDLEEATTMFHLYFAHLFMTVASELRSFCGTNSQARLNDETLPPSWRDHFRNGVRHRLFRDVIAEVQTSISNGDMTSSTASARAKSELTDLLNLLPAVVLDDTSNVSGLGFSYLSSSLSRSRNNTPEPGSLSLLIYVDEAHNIAEVPVSGFGMTLYDVMLRALTEYHTSHDLFVVFMSTSSRASYLAERAILAKSARKRVAFDLIPPFVEMPFDCHPNLEASIRPGQFRLQDIETLDFQVQFGRPLFWTLHEAYGPGKADKDIRWLASSKLVAQSSWTSAPYLRTDSAKYAVLDVLLNLEYQPFRTDSSEIMETLVASHMRTAFSIPKSRAYIYSGYPSEPILAEAALEIINAIEQKITAGNSLNDDTKQQITVGNSPNYLLTIFNDVDKGGAGAIDRGQRGENVGKLILLRAYVQAVHIDTKSQNYGRGCSLLTFLKCLFAERFHKLVLGCRPDNVTGGPSLKERFKNSWIRFTHFGRSADDAGMTTSNGWGAFLRGMALIGWESQDEVDAYLPVLKDKNAPIAEWNMTGIWVSFKRRIRPGPKAAYAIEDNHIKFFPPSSTSRQDPSATIRFDTDAASRRPYITLVMELGLTKAPPPGAYIPTTVVRPQGKRSSRGKSNRPRGGNPNAPPNVKSPSKIEVGTGPTRSSPRNASDQVVHPRYSITAKGCSETVYACIRAEEREIYNKLLQRGTVLAEHPRMENLNHVREMKPFWSVGLPAYKWLDDAFMQGRVRDPPELPQEASVTTGEFVKEQDSETDFEDDFEADSETGFEDDSEADSGNELPGVASPS